MSTMLRAGRAAVFAPLLLFLALGVPGTSAETPAKPPLDEVKDLEQGIGVSLSQREVQIYDLKRRELAVLIARRSSMLAPRVRPFAGLRTRA